MSADFNVEFERLKSRRDRILAAYRNMPETKRREPKAKGMWSHAANLHHVVKSDEVTLQNIQTSKIEPGVGPKDGLVFKMVIWVLSHRVRVPVPSGMVPDGDPTVDELETRWKEAFEGLKVAFDRVGPDAVVLMHQQLGPLSPWQVLRLAHAHYDYHEPEFFGTG